MSTSSAETAAKTIELRIAPRARDLGGFSVRRALPDDRRQMVGPFIFYDHFGPVQFMPGQGIDVRPHPHMGLRPLPIFSTGAFCIATVWRMFRRSRLAQ